MTGWSSSPLFAPGLLSGGIGAALLLASRSAATDAQAEASAPSGRAAPLTELLSPATERPCACYRERVCSDSEPIIDDRSREFQREYIVDRVRGVFLVETASGRVLVWPGLDSVSFVQGWARRPRGTGEAVEEKILPSGASVLLLGVPGSYEQMMAEMSAVAADQPLETLKALQTRADLRGLPCYWPRASGLEAREMDGDPADELAGPGLFLVAGAAFLGLAALLLGGAAAGFF